MKATQGIFWGSCDPSPTNKTRHIEFMKVVLGDLAPFCPPPTPPPEGSRRASGPIQLVARRRRCEKNVWIFKTVSPTSRPQQV